MVCLNSPKSVRSRRRRICMLASTILLSETLQRYNARKHWRFCISETSQKKVLRIENDEIANNDAGCDVVTFREANTVREGQLPGACLGKVKIEDSFQVRRFRKARRADISVEDPIQVRPKLRQERHSLFSTPSVRPRNMSLLNRAWKIFGRAVLQICRTYGADPLARNLPQFSFPNRHTVTTPVNIGDSAISETSQKKNVTDRKWRNRQ